jgi:hypothetical protein
VYCLLEFVWMRVPMSGVVFAPKYLSPLSSCVPVFCFGLASCALVKFTPFESLRGGCEGARGSSGIDYLTCTTS